MKLFELKQKIFGVLQFHDSVDVDFFQYPGLKVTYAAGKATIGADSVAGYCRGLTELAMGIAEGKESLLVEKKPQFTWCGAMLDMSRGSAMKVDAIKAYIDIMACLGMNMLMLYTEDMFPLEKYPFFGYKRGWYSLEQLRELDDYAWELGIEMIPCVQTLGHLEQYLRWPEAAPFRDTSFNLMPGTQESLDFIEEILKTMKDTFRSKHIHIGMDEVVNLGTGAHFRKHKGEVVDQQALLFDHLQKVCTLCRKLDYQPIVWSDQFFPNPKGGRIFTYDSYFPENYRERLPGNVRLMYWYYSSRKQNRYQTLIKRHKETGNPVAFAGAGWNWVGAAPDHKLTFDFMVPALEACLTENPEMVMNTLWSDAGLTPFFLCFPSNALFAEYQWSGKNANTDEVWRVNEFVTKTPRQVYDEMDKFYFGLLDNQNLGRVLLYWDVMETVGVTNGFLPDNLPDVFDGVEPMRTFRQAAEALDTYIADNGDWNDYFAYEAAALRTAAFKAELHTCLRSAYQRGDCDELKRMVECVLPACKESYQTFYGLLEKIRRREVSAFGWERHCKDYGFQIARLDYAAKILKSYLDGQLTEIEELEAESMHCHVTVYDTTQYD